ncbi:nucleoporin Nup61 [Schizosaccharomyces japonicus yFS275]|uniref:Nucleoporin Nup61 n=1 Tax=Schizosaccharomyces japonicus (strain yFS275 / FY16936) TaxID=402676 RepID=B6K6F2_SCHJY|nr:nucleoporin Nup61 [Schizosaccharomyces japonicus yFS275]EEB09106.1 nucleoporin Nup61 [Schizosaccharomyces japonicus yFS275]
MAKRGAEHQITKDSEESDDDRHGPAEIPTEASAEVLASRKIARPKSRKKTGATPTTAGGLFSNFLKNQSAPSTASSTKVEAKPTTVSNADYDVYLKKRGLNKCFVDAVTKSVENDAFADLAPLFSEYKKHWSSISSASITSKRNEISTSVPAPIATPKFAFSTPVAPATTNTFSFGLNGASNRKTTEEAAKAKLPSVSSASSTSTAAAPSFSFGATTKPSFSFSATSSEKPKEQTITKHEGKEVEPAAVSNSENTPSKTEQADSANFSWSADKPIKFNTPDKPFTFTNPLSAKKSPLADTKPMAFQSLGFSFGTNVKPAFSFNKTAEKSEEKPAAEKQSTEAKEEPKQEAEEKQDNESESSSAARTNDDLVAGKGEGEENEDSVINTRAKIYRFDKESKAYKDVGLGPLKINVDKDTGAARVIVRVDGSGKVLLNVRLCKDFKYEMAGKKEVKLPAASADGKSLDTYLIRVKEPSVAEELLNKLNKHKE